MATAAMINAEETTIRQWIDELDLPRGVRFKELREMTDSTGDPGWRITFSVSKKLALDKAFLKSLSEITDTLSKRIFALGSDHWPYVYFVEGR